MTGVNIFLMLSALSMFLTDIVGTKGCWNNWVVALLVVCCLCTLCVLDSVILAMINTDTSRNLWIRLFLRLGCFMKRRYPSNVSLLVALDVRLRDFSVALRKH